MLGGVDVEQPQLARTGVSEPVDDADRGGDVRAAAGADGLAADSEFGFALEDVEGVDMVGVAVLVDARELWSEAQLDYLEFGQLGEDAVVAGARASLSPSSGPITIPFSAGRSSRFIWSRWSRRARVWFDAGAGPARLVGGAGVSRG